MDKVTKHLVQLIWVWALSFVILRLTPKQIPPQVLGETSLLLKGGVLLRKTKTLLIVSLRETPSLG